MDQRQNSKSNWVKSPVSCVIAITFQICCGLERIRTMAAVWGQTRINFYPAQKALLPSSSKPLRDPSPDTLLSPSRTGQRKQERGTQSSAAHTQLLPGHPGHSSCLPMNMAWSSSSQRMRMINCTSESSLQREAMDVTMVSMSHHWQVLYFMSLYQGCWRAVINPLDRGFSSSKNPPVHWVQNKAQSFGFQVHRITELSGLEGTSGNLPVHPPKLFP